MAQKSSKQRAEEAVLDLKGKIRQLNKAVASKGATIDENAPLVTTIKAVEGLRTGGEEVTITIFRSSQFNEYQDEKLPPMKVAENIKGSSSLFQRCRALKAIPPIHGIETLTSFDSFARECSSLKVVTLPDLIKAERMSSAFYMCAALTSLTIGEIPKMKSMSSAFYKCESLTTVTLGSALSASYISGMFDGCTKLQTVTLDFSGGLLSRFEKAFNGCESLRTINGVIDITSVIEWNYASAFSSCTSLEEVRLKGLMVYLDLSACQSLSLESIRYLVENAQSVSDRGKRIDLSRKLLEANREEMERLGNIANSKGWTLNYR